MDSNNKIGIKNIINLLKYIILLALIPAALYFRVINYGISGFDDALIIYNVNNSPGNKINIQGAFTHDALMGEKGDTFYRPLQIISMMVDAETSGLQMWSYHLTNLLLHILTVITLFFFLKKTGVREEISFLLSLFFAVNPMLTNAVAWIPARGDLLLGLFCLLSFLTFIEYYNSQKRAYIIAHAVVFFLAILSKETAVLLPLIIISWHYFVQKKKTGIKEILPFLIIWLVSFMIFFSMRHFVLKIDHNSNELGIIPLLKNIPVIPVTFGKFFIPLNLTTMPFYTTTTIVTGLILIILTVIAVVKLIKLDKRAVIWGFLWFLAFTAPPMLFRTFIAKIGFEYFDYRVYLPSAGLLVILGLILNEVTVDIRSKTLLKVSIPILFIYAFIAVIHLPVFINPISFFTSAINSNSGNAMAYEERGLNYDQIGNREKAIEDYNQAIKAHPEYSSPYYNLGVLYGELGDHINAEKYFSLAVKYDTLNHEIRFLKDIAYINLSKAKLSLRKFDETIESLKQPVKDYPNSGYLHNNLGLAYYSRMKFDSALVEYNQAIELVNNDVNFYNNRGMAKYHLNDYNGAKLDFEKAQGLKPDNIEALGNMGMVKLKLNDNEGAVAEFTNEIKLSPTFGPAYYWRGIAYMNLNKEGDAKKDWLKSSELGFTKANEKLKNGK